MVLTTNIICNGFEYVQKDCKINIALHIQIIQMNFQKPGDSVLFLYQNIQLPNEAIVLNIDIGYRGILIYLQVIGSGSRFQENVRGKITAITFRM